MPFRHVSQSSRRFLSTAVAGVAALAVSLPALGLVPTPLETGPDSPVAVDRDDAVDAKGMAFLAPAHGPDGMMLDRDDAVEYLVQDLPVSIAEVAPTRLAAEPTPTAPAPTVAPKPEPEPEPAGDGDCPANSSPDCIYTYRHPIETWERLARCESNGRWDINTGNGYYGGLQFSLKSWQWVGGSDHPHHHSKWVQIHFAERLQARQGWAAWPACSRKLGLR